MDRTLFLIFAMGFVALLGTVTGRSTYTAEAAHPALCDADGHFQCPGNADNIPCLWTCDGQSDCPNGEDEVSCLRNSLVADQSNSDDDDGNESEEEAEDDDSFDPEDRDEYQCFDGDFQCANLECVPADWRCDDDPDCDDGSDEWNCNGYVRPRDDDDDDSTAHRQRSPYRHSLFGSVRRHLFGGFHRMRRL